MIKMVEVSAPMPRRRRRHGLVLALAFSAACIPASGAAPRAYAPARTTNFTGYVETSGVRIWYSSIGSGDPVILLHGGMASSRSWNAQVPALVAAGHRVILIDSRGHGRSTMGSLPLRYDLLVDDVLAVMSRLRLERPAVIGWSDGAIVALLLALRAGDRLRAVYAFGANMDKASVRRDAGAAPILARVAGILAADHAALSPEPDSFDRLRVAVRTMQAQQPDTTAAQLATIRTPITIAGATQDEFIKTTHFRALARSIPTAQLVLFRHAGHFIPWQKPALFNRSLLAFLRQASRRAE